MKKEYIQPAAELVELSAQGMLALSNGSRYIHSGSDDVTVDGTNIMTNRQSWNSDDWMDDEED